MKAMIMQKTGVLNANDVEDTIYSFKFTFGDDLETIFYNSKDKRVYFIIDCLRDGDMEVFKNQTLVYIKKD